MARYTVHIPANSATTRREVSVERAVFVRDGWSWSAFAFGPFWLLWNRHWITGVLALVIMGAVFAVLAALPMSEAACAGAILLLMALWGFEGSSLRRLALGRAGYTEDGLVVGSDPDALEQRFFAEMDGQAQNSVGVAPAAPVPSAPMSSATSPSGSALARAVPVIGLFPDSRKPS